MEEEIGLGGGKGGGRGGVNGEKSMWLREEVEGVGGGNGGRRRSEWRRRWS